MSAQKIVPFLFEGEQLVRVVQRGGEPWFVLADICKVLGIGNPSDAARRLDEDEKGVDTIDTLRGEQQMTIVSESGLYSLIFTSRKEAAKRFKKWVTSEVLPSIRRTGRYEPPAPEQPVGEHPYAEWSLEEVRTRLSVVNTYRHVMNNASAAWMMEREGFPMPPLHLLPAWRQAELTIPLGQNRGLTIIVPNGGSQN